MEPSRRSRERWREGVIRISNDGRTYSPSRNSATSARREPGVQLQPSQPSVRETVLSSGSPSTHLVDEDQPRVDKQQLLLDAQKFEWEMNEFGKRCDSSIEGVKSKAKKLSPLPKHKNAKTIEQERAKLNDARSKLFEQVGHVRDDATVSMAVLDTMRKADANNIKYNKTIAWSYEELEMRNIEQRNPVHSLNDEVFERRQRVRRRADDLSQSCKEWRKEWEAVSDSIFPRLEARKRLEEGLYCKMNDADIVAVDVAKTFGQHRVAKFVLIVRSRLLRDKLDPTPFTLGWWKLPTIVRRDLLPHLQTVTRLISAAHIVKYFCTPGCLDISCAKQEVEERIERTRQYTAVQMYYKHKNDAGAESDNSLIRLAHRDAKYFCKTVCSKYQGCGEREAGLKYVMAVIVDHSQLGLLQTRQAAKAFLSQNRSLVKEYHGLDDEVLDLHRERHLVFEMHDFFPDCGDDDANHSERNLETAFEPRGGLFGDGSLEDLGPVAEALEYV